MAELFIQGHTFVAQDEGSAIPKSASFKFEGNAEGAKKLKRNYAVFCGTLMPLKGEVV